MIGLYTGTRTGVILTASFNKGAGRSYVDLATGIFYRLPEGRRATNKRQTPVPIPSPLQAHMRRWKRCNVVRDYFVEWNGEPVHSVKTAFASAVKRAGLDGKLTPHTLRYTAATWLMQSGVDKWEAAGFLSMSVAMLDRVYCHRHPAHLRTAAHVFGYRRRDSLPIPLPEKPFARRPIRQHVENIGGGRSRVRTGL